MQLSIKGKQIDVGDALRTHVQDKLSEVAGKFFSNPIDASVVFSRDAHLYRCDISIHVGRGILLQGQSSANEPYPAFDGACERVSKQLRRYKGRLRDYHARPEEPDAVPANKIIFQGDSEGEAAEQPVIVAEMQTQIESLTPGEAVMRMDLGDLPALLFKNRAHGGLNMVYRRADGNIGWVDPTGNGQAQAAE